MATGPSRSSVGGGGAATTAGILFEQQVGALFAAWMVAEKPFDDRFHLGQAKVQWIRFETEAPVDDILVATSNGGFVALQVKTTASLSRDPASPFGKTVTQFVRQWLACRDGDGSQGWNRRLDIERDRLVLAVGRSAPASVREVLQSALRLVSQPGGGVLNQEQQRAYDDFEACVGQAWTAATDETFDPTFARQLAGLVYVLTFETAGIARQAVETVLSSALRANGEAPAAFSGLEALCGQLMAGRGGMDLATVRQQLQQLGLSLLPPADFRADIERLEKHSKSNAEALAQYEVIEATADEQITVPRDCQAAIVQAAKDGPLLIVGEPGAGKSGVLNALARELRADSDVLELAVDQYSVETLEGLRTELGLEHAILDILRAWDGAKPAWLVVDALDATRGGRGEAAFRALIDGVMKLGGRWKVVASIRTFDLRMGQQFRSLFKGTPPVQTLVEPGFANVRHVRVPPWTDKEYQDLLLKAPALAKVLVNASRSLADLASVPFNTRLLSDLVKDGLVSADLSHVASQAELLRLYWERRVEAHGTPALICLQAISEAMVKARALRAPLIAIGTLHAAILDELQRDGVLVLTGDRRWLQFRHHLLFDYAASRMLLDPDTLVDGTRAFAKTEAEGLMLTPALSFVLREVWLRAEDRADFWTAAGHILADSEGDPVIRSATGRICAEYPQLAADTAILAKRVVDGGQSAQKAFVHTSGALAIRMEDYPDTDLAPWIALVRGTADNVGPVSSTIRFLLFQLLPHAATADQRVDLGVAARALLSHAFDRDETQNLARAAIELVGDTYTSDIAASRAVLGKIFEPDRLGLHAAQEVPAISRKIEEIAEGDPAFAVQIYRHAFGFEVTHQQETTMSDSQILSLKSNARQDYGMARYALGQFFGKFLERHPDSAIAAIIAALEASVAREHSYSMVVMRDLEFAAGGRTVRLREDRSHVWAHDPESTYGDDAEALVRTLFKHLKTADEESALHIVDRLIETSALAIFWSRMFLVAADRGGRVLDTLLPIAMSEPFLTLPDTMKDAVDVIAKGYTSLSGSKRKAFEDGIQDYDFSAFDRPADAQARLERRLFGAIGQGDLETQRAKDIAGELSEPDYVPNDRLFVVKTSIGVPEPYHWIDELDHDADQNQALMAAIEKAKGALGLEGATPVNGSLTLAAGLQAMEDLLGEIDVVTQNPTLTIYAEGQISQGLARLLDLKLAPGQGDEDATARFLALLDIVAASAGPSLEPDTDTQFEDGASWGSPAPRVDAAMVVLDLVLARPDLYQRLQPMIDGLLCDPHPAARLQAALRLVRIWDIDRAGFWSRLSEHLQTETNLGVLDHVCSSVLGRVLHHNASETEDLIFRLLDRFAQEPERLGRIRKRVADMIAVLWVSYERPGSHCLLQEWVAQPELYSADLSEILAALRSAFSAGLEEDAMPAAPFGLRARAHGVAHELVIRVNGQLEAYSGLDEPSPLQKEQAGALASLIDDVCRQFYFASGAGKDRNTPSREFSDACLAVFLRECAPTLRAIGDFATPHTVYYLLQLVEYLLPISPADCFDLAMHALRQGGRRHGYQFEHIGADLLVRMIGVFLADHKELFADEARRTELIDCLEIFMEAGWPAANRLLYRLPEVMQ